MSLEIYPTIPPPFLSYPFDESFNTLVSDFEGENRQGQILDRFAKKGFTVSYKGVSIVNQWHLVHNFFKKKRRNGELFWFFDFFQRQWIDEYVGRGGPFPLDGAIADDGGVQTDETDAANAGTANGIVFVPAVPAVNDAYYWIKKIMFDKLTLTIGTQGAGVWTIVWEYLKSDLTWAALSGVTDGTAGFTAAAGAHDVTFTMPDDWVDTIIKQRWGYAIRARVSAYTSISAQPKGSGASVNTKTYDLPSKSTVNDATLKIYVNDLEKTRGGGSVQLITGDGKQIVTGDGKIIVLGGEVAGDYSFVSGGGGAGADRISLAAYQTQGALITGDLTGQLRIKAFMANKFSDNIALPEDADIQSIRISEW